MWKKRIFVMALLACVIGMLAGCTTSSGKSYTFSVDTGDQVKVELDTSDGYSLQQEDGTFTVSDEAGDEILNGTFGTAEAIDTYRSAVYSENAQVITDTDQELCWQTDDEYDRILKVSEQTCVIIGSLQDADTAEAAYERLTISLEE